MRFYVLIALIGHFIREYLFGNPFEPLIDGIEIGGIVLMPVVLNWISEPIIHVASYAMTGVVYDSGSEPIVGSLIYMFMYALNSGVLYVMSLCGFHLWSNILILIIYLVGFIKTASIVYDY